MKVYGVSRFDYLQKNSIKYRTKSEISTDANSSSVTFGRKGLNFKPRLSSWMMLNRYALIIASGSMIALSIVLIMLSCQIGLKRNSQPDSPCAEKYSEKDEYLAMLASVCCDFMALGLAKKSRDLALDAYAEREREEKERFCRTE